jgi:hypothetical protein
MCLGDLEFFQFGLMIHRADCPIYSQVSPEKSNSHVLQPRLRSSLKAYPQWKNSSLVIVPL